MLQQRKKDYLQRLIEEFFKKLNQAINGEVYLTNEEKELLLGECFDFFSENLKVSTTDETFVIIEKVSDIELLEQFAKMLMSVYDISEKKDKDILLKAFDITEYLQETDNTYSWSRVVLREDLLHRLDKDI